MVGGRGCEKRERGCLVFGVFVCVGFLFLANLI